jgi:hypothetical protein
MVEERIENLRLGRALKAVAVRPAEVPALAGQIERLEEYDRLIALGICSLETEGRRSDQIDREMHARLFEIGAHLRGELRAILPFGLRRLVQRACAAARVTEADVRADLERLADTERVRRHFGTLPRRGRRIWLPEHGRLEDWLRELPVAWLRCIAGAHAAARGGSRAELAERLATLLMDPSAVAACLVERVGPPERALLARYVGMHQAQVSLLSDEDEAALAPSWNGRGEMPACAGARLRAHGLLFLGWLEGTTEVISNPEDQRRLLARLLFEHHEDALRDLSPLHRDLLEEAARRPPCHGGGGRI